MVEFDRNIDARKKDWVLFTQLVNALFKIGEV